MLFSGKVKPKPRFSFLDSRFKSFSVFLVALLLTISSAVAEAKISKEFKTAIKEIYTPAVPHRGLETAQDILEPDKLKTFVVIEKGGVIPAERAFYMITPQEYDYRGAVVEGESVKTRTGRPYMHLPKGAVMTVSDVVFSGRKIYLKLISLEKLKSPTFPKKKPTRVTVMLGFKFDKSLLNMENLAQVTSKMEEWVKPFPTFQEAMKYSESTNHPH